jgi:endonuclease/exonuclease/phosphatase family metal-dependent hydrolase
MEKLRVATYNINCCRDYIDAWGDKSPRAVVAFIKEEKIDICGLNEVDVNSERSLGYDQPKFVKEKLEEETGEKYYYCFAAGLDGYHPPYDKEYVPTQGKAMYGNALVSRYPIVNYRTVKVALKEAPVAAGGYEHRVFIFADIQLKNEIVTVICTHFGTTKEERMLAIEILKNELEEIQNPVIFMGDLNAGRSSEEFLQIANLLKDATPNGEYYTFDTINPRWQIDYIFTDDEFEAENASMPDIRFSDHFPLVVDLKLKKDKKER